MIILLLISLIFPDNARDLGHFIIPAMTCQAGYEVADVVLAYTRMNETEKEFWKIMSGLTTTYLIFTLSKKLQAHYETEREWDLANSGLKCWQLGITIKFFLKLPAYSRQKKEVIPSSDTAPVDEIKMKINKGTGIKEEQEIIKGLTDKEVHDEIVKIVDDSSGGIKFVDLLVVLSAHAVMERERVI